MQITISHCPRCRAVFNRVRSAVCEKCRPEEDADYQRIRDAIAARPGLNPQEAADAARVSLDCVFRMIDEGHIASDSLLTGVKCGRCGAPAISHTRRLCAECLYKLDAELAKEVASARQRLKNAKAQGVYDALQKRRA